MRPRRGWKSLPFFVYLVETVGAELNERRGGRFELDELVGPFGRRREVVVAQTEIQLQPRSERDGVLHECADRVDVRVVGEAAERDRERAAESLLKRRHAGIRDPAGIAARAVVLHPTELAAELDDLVPVQIRRRIADRPRRYFAGAWEPCRASDVQAGARDGDLRKRNRVLALADVDADSPGVDLGGRIEADADAVVARAHFIHQRLVEDVRFVHRQDLPVPAAVVAEAGHGVALCVRFMAEIALECVVDMQVVVLLQIRPHVPRVLIVGDRGDLRSDRAQPRGVVRRRDVLEQVLRQRVGDRRALRVAQRPGVQVDRLLMPQALVAAEEEHLVLRDRSAEVGAELLAVEDRLRRRRWVEVVARVELLVAVEVEAFAVELVAARPCRDVDDGARVSPVFGAEGRVVDLELRDRVDRRLEGDLRIRQVVQIDAVDHHVDRGLAVASRHERERPLSAQRGAEPRVLRRRAPTGHERAEVDEMAPVQRNFLDGALCHRLAYGDGRCVDERRCAGDGHVLRQRADRHPQIERHRLGRPQIDVADLILETVQVRDHVIPAGRERGRDELARRIGRGRTFEVRRRVLDRDRHARHHGRLRVGGRALECCCGLGPRWRRHPEYGDQQCQQSDTRVRGSPHRSPSFAEQFSRNCKNGR